MQNQPLTERGKGFGFGILLASTLQERKEKLTETRELMLTVMAEDLGIQFDPAGALQVPNPWEFLTEIKEAVASKSESAGHAFELACHLIGLPATQQEVGANLTLEAMREVHFRKLTAKVGLQWRVVEGLYRTVKSGITSGEQLHRVWEPTIAHIFRVLEGFVSVFLSYSHDDKAFARQLKEALIGNGIKVWIDEGEITVGHSPLDRISKAIENSDFVIPIISTASIKSEWVQKELSLAMAKELSERRIQILPVLKDRCEIPDFLKDRLYANFSDLEKFNESVSDLVRAISMTEPDGDTKSPRELVSDFVVDFGFHSPSDSENPDAPPNADNPADDSTSDRGIRPLLGVLAAACIRAGLQRTPLPPQIESTVTALETSGSPFDTLGRMLRQMAKGDVPERVQKVFDSEVTPYIHEFVGMSSQASTNNPQIDAAWNLMSLKPYRLWKSVSHGVLIWVVGFVWGMIVFMTPLLKSIPSVPFVSKYPAVTVPLLILYLFLIYFLARRYLTKAVDKRNEAWKYGIVLLIVSIILDTLVIVVAFKGHDYYSYLSIWVAYALLLFVPVVESRTESRRD